MRRCVHCSKYVWRWQRAQDPAGNMRNDVHAVCRKMLDNCAAEIYDVVNKLCDRVGAPHPGDIYELTSVYSNFPTQYDVLRKKLRKQYGIKTKKWVLRNI